MNDGQRDFQDDPTPSLLHPPSSPKRLAAASTVARLPPSTFMNKKNLEEGWTINQLRFQNLGVHGRQREIDTLEECLERISSCPVTSSATRRELVMIKGASGTGKSKLLDVVQTSVSRKKGIFARGKFDLEHRHLPYSGMFQVVDTIFKEVQKFETEDPERFEKIRNQLEEAGGDKSLNRDLFLMLFGRRTMLSRSPGIRHLYSSKNITMMYNQESFRGFKRRRNLLLRDDMACNKNRLHYIFQRIFRVAALTCCPLVVALDDIQWADSGSLEIMEMIMTYHQQPGYRIMIIGCYRIDKLDNTNLISTTLKDIQSACQRDEDAMRSTEIILGNLDVENVNLMLMDLLDIDDEAQTHGLAEICHRRTDGNPFFVAAFVSSLKEEGLLEYNFGLMRWKWTDSEIEEKTKATKNVVELIQPKLVSQLDNEVGMLLKIASCLGNTFEERLVSILWEGMSCSEVANIRTGKSSHELLKVAMDQSFVEQADESASRLAYRWIHDKVQETVISSIQPPELLRMLKVEAGEILMQNLSEEELDAEIFIVCNLLNAGPVPTDRRQRIRIAESNLRAAQKAIEFSAFDNAVSYSSKGIECLPKEDCWQRNKGLSLELYSTAVEVANHVGNVIDMEQNIGIVLDQPNCSLQDKFRVYKSQIESISFRASAKEALSLCFNVLRKLGCRFPSEQSPIAAPYAYIRLMSVCKDSQVLTEMGSIDREPRDIMISEKLNFLRYAGRNCYLLGHKKQLTLIVLKMLALTRKYGISHDSPLIFIATAILVLGGLGKVSTACLYADTSVKLAERFQDPKLEAHCMFLACLQVYHWSRPFASMLKPLLKCYETCLQMGDSRIAMQSILVYCGFSLHSGKALGNIAQDLRVYIEQMKDLELEGQVAQGTLMHQVIENLIGRSQQSFLNCDTHVSVFGQGIVRHLQIFGCLFLGDYENAAKLTIATSNDMAESLSGAVPMSIGPFYRAISFFALAKGNRGCKRMAIKFSKITKKWSNKGNPNVMHQELLLDAEVAVLGKNHELASEKFQRSIVQASRGGVIHEAALAKERFANFLLHELGDKNEAMFQIEQAIDLYTEWGAFRKVALLRKEYPIEGL